LATVVRSATGYLWLVLQRCEAALDEYRDVFRSDLDHTLLVGLVLSTVDAGACHAIGGGHEGISRCRFPI
jgi:hypothetical protein